MIIKCNKTQQDEIVEYIGAEYGKCLYLYIDLIKYGCDSDFANVWKVEDDNGINLVMLSYHSALHLYSRNRDFNSEEIANFIRDINPSIVCAEKPLILVLKPLLSTDGYVTELGYIGKKTHSIKPNVSFPVEIAQEGDIEQIAKLLFEDDDIGASYSFEDLVSQIKERLSQGFVRSFVVKNKGEVIAHLGTGAEINKLCTISYVITDPKYRGKGLSSSLFCYACNQLESEGKEIFSVYYPENSRRLHHKMGFDDYCEFGKLFRKL